MKRVLFVDSDEAFLSGIYTMLSSVRTDWDIKTATSAKEATTIIGSEGEFDVLCTEMMLPDASGDKLLSVIMDRYPQTVRMVLSGYLDSPAIVRAGGIAHQILGKPCNKHFLRDRLSRAFSLDHHLPECNAKLALLKMCGIPSVPKVYWELHAAIRSPKVTPASIASIIETDPSMTAKLLQLAHTAHGGERRVTNISEAVQLLGVEAIQSLVLMPGIFEMAAELEMPEGFTLSRLWEHALKVAKYAARIVANDTDNTAAIDEAYTAGLLHDIGFLIVSTKMADDFRKVLEYRKTNGIPLIDAEKKVFSATHAQMGGFLLDLWGISDCIVEAISFHLYPCYAPERTYEFYTAEETSINTLTALHVANYICEGEDPLIPDQEKADVDHIHLETIGMTHRMDEWVEVCMG